MSGRRRGGLGVPGRRSHGALGMAAVCLLVSGHPAAAAPALLAQGPSGAAGCSTSAVVDAFISGWRALTDERESLSDEVLTRRLDEMIASTLDIPGISARVLPGIWSQLPPGERRRFERALVESLRKGMLGLAGEGGDRLVLAEATSEGGEAYRLQMGDGETVSLSLSVDRQGGSCRVADVAADDRGLVAAYRERTLPLVEHYSLAYAIAKIADRDQVVLEDFESTPVGELPIGWSWKEKDDAKPKPYRVREEDGNRYLEATDEGESVILGKEVAWNLNEYPYISFRVRVNAIPEGGDERYDKTVDSAAGIYITYRRKTLGLIPESVKYVWSSTLPVGSAAIREGVGRPWQIVFGSGEEGLGEWRTYVFDLRDAYRKTFGGNPPERPLGIGILSDANSTHSKAYADYDDILALREAGEGVTGGVKKILTRRRRRRR